MKPGRQVWDWRSYIIHYAPNNGTYRHVLLTLSCYMDSSGGSCFPSIESLIQATSLTRPTVIKYLNKAEEDGWIKKSIHGFSGKGWKRNQYTASIPGEVLLEINQKDEEKENIKEVSPENKAVNEVNYEEQGGKPDSGRRLTSSSMVVKEVNSISPYTSPSNSPESARGREGPSDFSRLNETPIPEPFQTEEFFTEYREFMDYMLEEKQVEVTPRKTERHIQELFRLKQQGNDPVKVIRQTIMSDNKSFYPLREKQFNSNRVSEPNSNNPIYQEL